MTATPLNDPADTRRYLAVSGAFAALVTIAGMFLRREVTNSETVVETIANMVLSIMPMEVFSFFLQLLGGWGKPLLLISVILGLITIGSWVGYIERSPAEQLSVLRRVWRMIGLAVGVWIPLLLFTLLASIPADGVSLTMDEITASALSLAIDAATFSLAYATMYQLISFSAAETESVDEPPVSPGRRRVVSYLATGIIGVAASGYLGRLLLDTRAGAPDDDSGELSQPVTPNADFYTVSKNFIDPSPSADGWTLDVQGMVEREISITYDELREMPPVEQHATLTCISNEIGGNLIDNAVWTGVRLRDVLEMAGIAGEPRRVAFFGSDGYSDSFEIEKAEEPGTIIAYLMNGERLPDSHGYPARLIVPGKYGIKNGKWLERLDLVDEFRGYWQRRGWTNDGTIKTLSMFESPASRAVLSSDDALLGGIAFAGDRGIERVEFSIDGGATWNQADDLEQPGEYSWKLWRARWRPP
ncbi:MAG: molybdopterin-dependent oxidoreductase, partial [Chloroflexota bacterium]